MIVQLNLKRLQISHNLFDSALALICKQPIVQFGCQLDVMPNFKICLIHDVIKKV